MSKRKLLLHLRNHQELKPNENVDWDPRYSQPRMAGEAKISKSQPENTPSACVGVILNLMTPNLVVMLGTMWGTPTKNLDRFGDGCIYCDFALRRQSAKGQTFAGLMYVIKSWFLLIFLSPDDSPDNFEAPDVKK